MKRISGYDPLACSSENTKRDQCTLKLKLTLFHKQNLCIISQRLLSLFAKFASILLWRIFEKFRNNLVSDVRTQKPSQLTNSALDNDTVSKTIIPVIR